MPNCRLYRAWIAAAMAIVIGFAAPAMAATDEANPEQVSEQAPVEFDGAVLFRVRGATSFPAGARADGIVKRIEEAAADPAVDPSSVRTGTSEGLAAIFAG